MRQTTTRLTTVFAAIVAAFATSAAHAAYTEISDDITPVAPATFRTSYAQSATQFSAPLAIPSKTTASRDTTAPNLTPMPALVKAPRADLPNYDGGNITLDFNKGTSEIPNDAAETVSNLLENIQGQKITIIGRPDATPYEKLAQNRAIKLKRLLVRNGITPSNIVIQYDNSANSAEKGGTYPVDLLIGTPQKKISAIRETITPLTQTDAITPAIQRILGAVQSGRMTPASALNVIAELVGANLAVAAPLSANNNGLDPAANNNDFTPAIPGQPLRSAYQAPTARPAPMAYEQAPQTRFQIAATRETARPEEWTLSDAGTLKDNVAAWASTKGYTLDWAAANFYRVGPNNPTVKGDMLDAVDKVTTALGLKMEVSKSRKLICINDKESVVTTSCANKQSFAAK